MYRARLTINNYQERLKEIIEEKGLTYREIGLQLGISHVHVSNILNRKRQLSVQLLFKVKIYAESIEQE